METEAVLPGAVEFDLGQFRLIPGPKGDTGERGPRGYGIKSAVLNPDYTLTLSFEDGSSYTTPSIRGQAAAEVTDVRLEEGEYQGSCIDKLVVEMSDGRLFEFEIYNKAARYYLKADEARELAERARDAAADYEDAAGESADKARISSEAAAASDADARLARDEAVAAWKKAEASEKSAGDSAESAGKDAAHAQALADRAGLDADKAERARQAIENMTVTAKTLPSGEAATVEKTRLEGFVNLLFGIPRGEQGAVGPKGEQGIQGVPGPQGEPGANGVAVAAEGQYAFDVDADGHLWLYYTGDEAPDFSLEEDGHLCLDLVA